VPALNDEGRHVVILFAMTIKFTHVLIFLTELCFLGVRQAVAEEVQLSPLDLTVAQQGGVLQE